MFPSLALSCHVPIHHDTLKQKLVGRLDCFELNPEICNLVADLFIKDLSIDEVKEHAYGKGALSCINLGFRFDAAICHLDSAESQLTSHPSHPFLPSWFPRFADPGFERFPEIPGPDTPGSLDVDLDYHEPFHGMKRVWTKKLGNCAYESASFAITGTRAFALVLRKYTPIYMVKNKPDFIENFDLNLDYRGDRKWAAVMLKGTQGPHRLHHQSSA